MKRAFLIAMTALALPWAGTAWAGVWGNPAPTVKPGDTQAGLALSDDRQTVFLDYGITDGGALRALAGAFDFGSGADGTEFGVGYRQSVGSPFSLGDQRVQPGVLAYYRLGSADVFKFQEIDVGAGGSFTPVKRINVYGGAVYRHFRSEVDVNVPFVGKRTATSTDSDLGLMVGAEFVPSPKLVLGGELHFGFNNPDDDIGLYATLRF